MATCLFTNLLYYGNVVTSCACRVIAVLVHLPIQILFCSITSIDSHHAHGVHHTGRSYCGFGDCNPFSLPFFFVFANICLAPQNKYHTKGLSGGVLFVSGYGSYGF